MNTNLVDPPEQDPSIAETRLFWREMGKDFLQKSVETIDGTAKQIIVVVGILEGLYFHAIAYSDIRGQLNNGEVWIYLAPILILLVSLISALLVFFPDRYRLDPRSASAAEIIYKRVVRAKYWALFSASVFLILGVAGMFLAVYTFLIG